MIPSKFFILWGEIDGCDESELNSLQEMGFSSVDLEDSGAKLTIFDDYDTQEHFEQINDFINLTSCHFENKEYDAYELCMLLSDINPKLFNSLGAAVRAIKHDQNEEDTAQVALSGRRYLEQLADVLYKPSDEKINGRDVRKANYKNRIWAFIETSIKQNGDATEKITILGKEIDRLVELFNTAIHSEPIKDTIIKGFADLAKISLILLTLQPLYSRDPYYAYQKRINEFFQTI